MEEKASEEAPTLSKLTTSKTRPIIPRNHSRRVRPPNPKPNIEAMSSSSDGVGDDSASEQIAPYTKRRKVLTPPRGVNPSRAVKQKSVRPAAAPPTRPRQTKPRDGLPRTSSRLNANTSTTTTTPALPLTAHSSQSGFSSTNDPPPVRPGGKNTTKKK